MSTRAYVAGRIREVNALWQQCPEPRPSIAGETFGFLHRELDHALQTGHDARARRLVDDWHHEVTSKLAAHLLSAPVEEAA